MQAGKKGPRAGRGGARGPRTGFDGEDGVAAVHAARAVDLSAVGVCAPAGAGGGVALHGHEVALLVALRDEGARHDAGRGELRSARAAARSGVGAWRPKQPTTVSKESALETKQEEFGVSSTGQLLRFFDCRIQELDLEQTVACQTFC